jgi:DNA-binding transcriptional ArsR family regulator
MNTRARVYQNISELMLAFSSPARLKILQMLGQASWSVEQLANHTGESVANTSQHLQRLARAGLVTWRKDGVSRIYSVASPGVLALWEQMQDLSHELIPGLDELQNELTDSGLKAEIPASEALREVARGKAVLLDVRSAEESGSTPVAGAVPLPASEQFNSARIAALGLHKKEPVYVLCRGRYCHLATEAVRELRKRGFDAYRLQESPFRLIELQKAEAVQPNPKRRVSP